MKEYFIVQRSFAAPFVSDTDEVFVTAESPDLALEKAAAEYRHPFGLYAAEAYDDANAFHKGKPFLAQWLSNHEAVKQRLTKGLGSYSYCGSGPGKFEINGELIVVDDPYSGAVVKNV